MLLSAMLSRRLPASGRWVDLTPPPAPRHLNTARKEITHDMNYLQFSMFSRIRRPPLSVGDLVARTLRKNKVSLLRLAPLGVDLLARLKDVVEQTKEQEHAEETNSDFAGPPGSVGFLFDHYRQS